MNLNDLASYNEELADRIRKSPCEVLPLFEEAAREVADEVSTRAALVFKRCEKMLNRGSGADFAFL